MPYEFDDPRWLWLCALIPLLIVGSFRSLAGLDPVRRVCALLVRSLVILLVAVCLAGVQYVQRNDDLTVMFIMDRSHSVERMEQYQEEFVRRAASDIPDKDRVGLIDFARNAFLEQLPMRGGYFIEPGRLPRMPGNDRTDVASALRLAMAMFPHDTAKRVVLMSDGNDNMGDVLAEARRAKADGIPVDIVPLQYQHQNEVYFDRLMAPTHAEPGEQLPLRLVLHSYQRVSGNLRIFQNGKLLDLPEESTRVTLDPGSNTFFMKVTAGESGTETFEAVFEPDDAELDAVALNNRASSFTFVSGETKALLISNNVEHDRPLVDAIRSEGVKIDMVDAGNLGAFNLVEMMNYGAILLANVPAAAFTEQQQQQLATYVRDMGSGLIMLGGDESYGAGGWIGSPVEDVLPVEFEIKHKRVIPRGALVLIMHSCEIPRGNFWGKEMAKKSVDTISSQDYVGVLAYTFTPGGVNWEVPLDLATNKPAVKARIDRMQIGDMPDFGQSMRLAYDGLVRGRGRDAAQKHTIILSDGDAQAPPQALVRQFAQQGITVSTIGIGWGAHVMDRTLKQIAKDTGGEYYAARNPNQLPQIFVKESKTVRRPLIIDEQFQPQVKDAFSDLLGSGRGMFRTPPLGGMVLTSPRDNPNVIMPLVRQSEEGFDPVLVHWQIELGKAVAFTSGWWPVWGGEWTAWPAFARFWAQVVRWSMRQDSPANFDTYARVEGSRGKIVIDALDKDATYLNNLELRAKVVGADGKAKPIEFTQHGPGNYQADFDAEQSGQYLTSVQVYDGDKMLGTVRTGLSVPFSPEYRDLMPNEALLRQVADITGGRWLDVEPEKAGVFAHNLPPSEAKKPAWNWVLAWLVLPLFLLDVAVRRLASWLALSIAVEVVLLAVLLFGAGLIYSAWWGILGAFLFAELVGWSIRYQYIRPLLDFLTHGVTATARAGERSAASLEQLRGTRDRVREGLSSEQETSGRKIAEEEPTQRIAGIAKRRYDVGEEAGAAPPADVSEAVGGASESEGESIKGKGSASEGGEESMTSRLLRAKKRANPDDEK